MSRYRGPKLRIIRRFEGKVVLPGLTTKRSIKSQPPGKPKPDDEDEDNKKNKKPTEYGLRLNEKQKLKFNYGLTENQLFRYVREARRRKGVTGLILLQMLEMRLDTLCFTLGFAKSIAQARQLVNHGHITVNQKVVNIPSFQCQIKDIIAIKEKNISKNLITENIKINQRQELPRHLEFNDSKLSATVKDYCDRDDVQLKLNELLVIEYYSRR
jgi:small subunit ribosomal protein S4